MASEGDKQEQLARARAKAEWFQDKLQTRLYPLHPDDFIPLAAERVEQALASVDSLDMQAMRSWPAHHLIHAMEACCAYHRKYLRKSTTQADLVDVINTYHNYHDTFSEWVLSPDFGLKGVELFVAAAARQQFHLQRTWGADDFARGVLLFNEASFPRTHPAFVEKVGFTFTNWRDFCFGLHSGLLKQPNNVLPQGFVDGMARLLAPKGAERLIERACVASEAVRTEYLKLRGKAALHDLFLPSIITRAPLFRRSSGDYVAVSKRLVLGHATDTIYNFAKNAFPNTFPDEFGRVFERYVGKVVGELSGASVFTEKDVQRCLRTGDKLVDYVVSTDDAVWLLECKATALTTTVVTEEAIAGSNAVTKISKAMTQLAFVAKKLREGHLDALVGPVRERCVIAGVVTYGPVPLANSSLCWQFTGAPCLDETGDAGLFTHRPQVFEVTDLERLIGASTQDMKNIIQIHEEKLTHAEAGLVTGDWSNFLNRTNRNRTMLPFLSQEWDRWSEDVKVRIKHLREGMRTGP